MNNLKYNLYFLCMIIMICGLVSCSGSKELISDNSSQNLTEIKENLKFKTHFDADGSMNIKATNSSAESLDISKISVILDQVDGNQSQAYSLVELGIRPEIPSSEMAIFDLSLEERIKEDFNGVAGKYNIILAYDSQKAIENTDNRSVYFVTYMYTIK